MSPRCHQKVLRMIAIVAERTVWTPQLAQVSRMRQWVLEAQHLLDGSWAGPGEIVSNQTVGRRLDRWRQTLARQLAKGMFSELEQAVV